MSFAYWLCAAVTVVSSSVSLGYSVVALRAAHADNTLARYVAARSAALFVVAVVALIVCSVPFVAAVATAMIIVQGLDAAIGALISDRMKTVGPAATATVNAAALVWMLTVA